MVASRSALKAARRDADRRTSAGDHVGAFVGLSHALKLAEALLEANNDQEVAGNSIPQILSQRSRSLLKMNNHYLALEDARRLTDLEPASPAGHQRLAEVYQATGHFDRAHDCYLRCFQLSSAKKEQDGFMELMKACKRELARERDIDEKFPWVGAAVGIVISVSAVVADQVLLREEAHLDNPILKVAVVVAVSLTCFCLARLYRRLAAASKDSLLEEPVDLLRELGHSKED